MIKQDYNGWSSKETWNINLMYEEIFVNMCEEQEFDDLDHLAEAFGSIVEELEFEPLKPGTLAHQAVGEYLYAINWMEIAEHYASDFDLFQEEEEEEVDEEVERLNNSNVITE
jgi:hypothetical protein